MAVLSEEMLMGTTRMLCLHGYHGSSAILRRQNAPLAAVLPAHVELVFVDAPSLSSGDFGWCEGFRGWERTRDWAIELLNLQQFDGIVGFSQGAALAGLLAAVRDSDSAPISFDWAIMVSGFTSTLPQHAHLFRQKLTVPSLHVMGSRRHYCADGRFTAAGRTLRPAAHYRAPRRTRYPRRPGGHDADC
jgi:pimeloyl-ACP methyl ester carboxylesterase